MSFKNEDTKTFPDKQKLRVHRCPTRKAKRSSSGRSDGTLTSNLNPCKEIQNTTKGTTWLNIKHNINAFLFATPFYLKTHLHEVMIMVYVDGQTRYKDTLYNNNSRKRENGAKFLYTNEIKLV